MPERLLTFPNPVSLDLMRIYMKSAAEQTQSILRVDYREKMVFDYTDPEERNTVESTLNGVYIKDCVEAILRAQETESANPPNSYFGAIQLSSSDEKYIEELVKIFRRIPRIEVSVL